MALVTARRTATTFLSRCLGPSLCSSSICSRSRFAIAALNNQSLVNAITIPSRPKTTKSGCWPLTNQAPIWRDRLLKGMPFDGCDYEHWLIIMTFTQDPKPSREEMIDTYVKTLAEVVGSEAEAKKKIYSVSTTIYNGFGALISEELSNKVKSLPEVHWVLPDSYHDVPNKDYGGDLYEDGKITPRPQYWANSSWGRFFPR